jgi:sialate O-acetylesterase
MPVPVWGTAAPGESVTVQFAGHTAKTEADANGEWKVALPALEASSEGRDFRIEGKNRVVFKDVLVGEVWICCGQSNMQYGWGKESHPMFNWGGVPELAKRVPEARRKPIRTYHVRVNVSFAPEANCKGKWSTDVSGSAVAFGFSYELQRALNVPVAVIVTCWGSSSIEGWMPLDMTEQLPHFKQMMERFQASEQAQKRVKAAIERGIRHGYVFVRKQPNLLYNAMLHPVIPYACRGMVWYQGEANATRPQEYEASFPLWVKRLRKGWGRGDFHLLAVMLPGFGKDNGRPDAKSWAWFRDVQMKILQLPHTGVANTIDLGDVKNIHPADKAPICTRLALLARRDVYCERITGRGPTFKGSSVNGNRMVIELTHADGLKTTDGAAPKGFWLADKEGSWHPAVASVEGNTVVLRSEAVAQPKACRYAFCGKPEVNLVNGDNLPAYPFRTDSWAK